MWIRRILAIPLIILFFVFFTVAFDLKGRVDAIAEGTIEVLTGEETYEHVLDTLITPIIEDNIGTEVS